MDDEVRVGWQIAPEIRAAMRLDRARTAMHRGEFGAAVMELEELLDEEPDNPEALFLLGEALIELGDFEGALQAYEHHLEMGADPNPRTLTGLAIARFNTCDLSGAAAAAREAVRLAPEAAEAHYYLGLALERLPNRGGSAVGSFAAANQLDPTAFPFPLQVGVQEWQGLIQDAMVLLPRSLQDFWADIPILLENLPNLDELRSADPPITPTVTGLYQGVPPLDADPWLVRPQALRLYTGNLVRSPTTEDLVEAIARTLEHEARDWIGLGEDEPL
ncbi:MAG: tetratricopeptide repeat protein [Deltaproteobacteria bacterium]|nr:tetratricopeptide repeat protein [Deltaproteobacteria bacterium]